MTLALPQFTTGMPLTPAHMETVRLALLAIQGGTANGAFSSASNDWLSAEVSWPVPDSTAKVLAPDGRIAHVAASRASDLSPDYNSEQTTIGYASFVVNDVTDRDLDIYGFYGEARAHAGAEGVSFGMELDAINLGTAATNPASPYHPLFGGAAVAQWLASGGEVIGATDAQLALGITDNGAKFKTGITFACTALTGTDGVTGFGEAIALAKGHIIQWYRADGGNGTKGPSIVSTHSGSGDPASLQFQDGGTLLLNSAGKTVFAVTTGSGFVNGMGVTGGAAGVAPALSVFGSDTDVSMALKTKGAGLIVPYAPIKADSGVGNVLQLVGSQNLMWLSNGGSQVAAIEATVSSGTNFGLLNFTDTGPVFTIGAGGAAKVVFSASGTVSSVNRLSAAAAATGLAPSLTAQGADTDIDILFTPQGAGTMSWLVPVATSANSGGGTALPATPVGYTIERINGTLRKRAYYAV